MLNNGFAPYRSFIAIIKNIFKQTPVFYDNVHFQRITAVFAHYRAIPTIHHCYKPLPHIFALLLTFFKPTTRSNTFPNRFRPLF
jgi:hypothetical protein